MNRHLIGQALRGLAVFLAGIGVAHAGSFSVNPVRVTLSAKQPVAAITVRNGGSEPAVIQIETSAWSQEQGQEVLVPSSDVLATPPIFTVAPGKAQILRIGLRRPTADKGETTYRLLLREVPPATPTSTTGMRVALNISMPVFVLPIAGTVAPALEWRATRTVDGQIRVHVTNSGNAHVQLSKINIAQADGQALGSREIAEYVLPGNTRSWTVKTTSPAAAGTQIHITSATDAGPYESKVSLGVETAAAGGTHSR